MKARRLHTDVLVAVAGAGACAGALVLTFSFATAPAAIAEGMGAEVFPRLVIAVMAVLAIGIAVTARGRVEKPRERCRGWSTGPRGDARRHGVARARRHGCGDDRRDDRPGGDVGREALDARMASGLGLLLVIYGFFTKVFGIPLQRVLAGERLF